jgi:anti-repressor protein
MTSVVSFNFGVNPVRVLVDERGEPWWIAADVCAVLEIANPRDAMSRLDPDEKGVGSTDTPGGRQEMVTVSESGLYSLVLGSRKPEARAFKKWITSEVIPSIRKTGGYSVQAFQVPKTLQDALRLAADALDAKAALECQVEAMQPKALFHDRVAECKDGQSIGDVAKILGTGQNRLFAWLRGRGILMASNLPYQEHIDAGRFRVIEQTWEGRSGQHVSAKTLVTGKGLIWIQRIWCEEAEMVA